IRIIDSCYVGKSLRRYKLELSMKSQWFKFGQLEETQHFCRWRQKQVAKSVQYELRTLFNNLRTSFQ
ncbi:MAG TPA: hypothetical protein VFD62_05425, partial [Pyrinomonadaceae bacterium]|nr:hypothetical protein [Pyrinomonadaceae bacterium]